ncbi:hypothetical protein [Streptomyces sp. NPDC053755]
MTCAGARAGGLVDRVPRHDHRCAPAGHHGTGLVVSDTCEAWLRVE